MAELVQVRIKGLVSTSRYGAMSSGDTLRTDAAYARHLVEELKVADYVHASKVEPTVSEAPKPAPSTEAHKHEHKRNKKWR